MTDVKFYGPNDCGCFADGCFGHDHLRTVLQLLLVENQCQERELIDALDGEMSDDGSEEMEAIEWLNTNRCERDPVSHEPLVYFEMDAGDLILFPWSDHPLSDTDPDDSPSDPMPHHPIRKALASYLIDSRNRHHLDGDAWWALSEEWQELRGLSVEELRKVADHD